MFKRILSYFAPKRKGQILTTAQALDLSLVYGFYAVNWEMVKW